MEELERQGRTDTARWEIILIRLHRISVVILLGMLSAVSAPSWATPAPSDVYLIDSHGQVVEGGDLNRIIRVMDTAGVYRTILSAIGDLSPMAIVNLAQQYPGRIIPAVTTKGPGYAGSNPGEYYARLAGQINSGRFSAMAEVLIYHAQKGSASEKIVPPEDQRVQTALQYAIARGWPFIMHIEFAVIDTREERDKFMRQFEAVVAAHPDHPFVLTHMGQLHAGEVQRLIEAHPNLYFQTSATIRGLAARTGQPWVNLFLENGSLMPEWRRLFIRYPTRFAFAVDAIGGEFRESDGYYMYSIRAWRWALASLPSTVAEAVAHGNAERLWKLQPKSP